MKTAWDYLEKAQQCREQAARASSLAGRASLLAMAENWEKLAQQRLERAKKRAKALQDALARD